MTDQWQLSQTADRQRDRYGHLRSELIGLHVVIRRMMESDATSEVPIVMHHLCGSLLDEAKVLLGNRPAVASAIELVSRPPLRAVDLFAAVAQVLRLIPLPPRPNHRA
jgi:hypothetical protein